MTKKINFFPFRPEFRAWIPKQDDQIYGGEPKMYCQNDQYLSELNMANKRLEPRARCSDYKKCRSTGDLIFKQ